MKTEAERLRELVAINRAIAGTTAYDAILELIVAQAHDLTAASACVLLLAEPGATASIVAAVGVSPERERGFSAVLDERIGALLRAHLGLGDADRILAVPMILRGDVRGVLAVVHAGAGDADGDEYLLSALADQAAIALGHAMHVRELQAAVATAERERAARERVVEALADERIWLRAVIEHSPVAVLLVERPDGGRVTGNRSAVALFGRPLDPAAGIDQYAGQLRTPDGRALPRDEVPSLVAMRGERVERELVVRRRDDTEVPVVACAAPIHGTRGELLGSVAIYEDVSTLKALQRTREEWTSIVAHDLRQPVNAIALRAELVARRSKADPSTAGDARNIAASARHLGRMIRDLLDVSVIEGGHLSLARRPRAVAPMLREILERCTPPAEQGRVKLSLGDGLPVVLADAERIEQVVANLLSNAFKYGDPEAPVELRAEARGEAVEVMVRNHGPGMSDGMERLFRRFQRGQARGAPREGLGLGLFICRAIVEAHGGEIWAESTPDDTTVFHFTLPAATSVSHSPS